MFKDETIVAKIGLLEELEQKLPVYTFMSGPALGQIHLLKEGEYLVGRSKDSNIVVRDDAISRQHFKTTVKGNEVWVEDLGSTNGTFINGKRIQKAILQDKDTIQISSQTIIAFSRITDLELEKQQKIYQMANYDPVTMCRTKYYFMDQFNQEFSIANRKGMPLSLMMFDIDYFKKVNDTYGHPAGDYVLKRVSEITQSMIRTEDLFARVGGEEFSILMRETRELDAVSLAQRIKDQIANTEMVFDQHVFGITVSMGISTLINSNFKNADEMIKSADAYLYFSKQNGRNRVSSLSILNPAL